ncbi:hypothetical protein AB3S75_000345 [Citrus x aurantiifolia]
MSLPPMVNVGVAFNDTGTSSRFAVQTVVFPEGLAITKFLLKSQSLICRTQIQIGLKMSAMSWVAWKVTVKSLPLLILVGGGDVVEQ